MDKVTRRLESAWYTQAEVGAMTGLSVRTVRRLIASGELPAVRIGRSRIRIREVDVLNLGKPVRPIGGAA